MKFIKVLVNGQPAYINVEKIIMVRKADAYSYLVIEGIKDEVVYQIPADEVISAIGGVAGTFESAKKL